MRNLILSVIVIMAVITAICPSWAQTENGENSAVKRYVAVNEIPEYQTRDGIEKAAKMVLSGEVTVNLKGQLSPVRTSHPSGISRSEGRRIARRVAEVARVNARRHSDVIAGEAVRKAKIAANQAEANANLYTKSRVSEIEPAIAGATTWGKWGVTLAIIALLGLFAVVAFLIRVFRGSSRYCPDI